MLRREGEGKHKGGCAVCCLSLFLSLSWILGFSLYNFGANVKRKKEKNKDEQDSATYTQRIKEQ